MRRRSAPAHRLPGNVWILAAISLSVALGYGIVAPVLPNFARTFGVSNFAAAAVVSAFALMRLVFAPAVGRLDDRFGERTVLASGIIIVAVSSALAGLAPTYPALLVLRGIGGVGSAMFSVAALSLLLAAVAPEFRGRATALYQGGFLAGAIAGPGLGGIVAAISIRAPFFVYAGTLAVAAAWALRLTSLPRAATPQPDAAAPAPSAEPGPSPAAAPERAEPPDPASPPNRPDAPDQATPPDQAIATGGADHPWRRVVRDPDYQAALAATLAAGWNSNGVRGSIVPLLVAATLYHDPAEAARWTGIALAIAAAVQALAVLPAGALVDAVGRRVPMIVGSALALAAAISIPLTRTIWQLAAVLALYALASATMGSAPAAVVGDVAGPRGDRAVALFSMAGDLGAIVGPLAAGALVDRSGFRAAFWSGAVLWVLACVMAARMPDRYRRS